MLPKSSNSNAVCCNTLTAVYCISGNAEVGTRTKKRGNRIAGALVLPQKVTEYLQLNFLIRDFLVERVSSATRAVNNV